MFYRNTKEKPVNKNKKNFLGGFTLLETLVTIFVFTLLMGGISILFKTVFTTSTRQTLAINIADQARKVTFNFTNEVRNATTGNDGAYPINLADDSQFIFFSRYGASGTAVNRIRYYVSSNTLYRGVVAPGGGSPTYNLSTEVVRPVQIGLANGSVPAFYYFNDTYAGTTTPLVQPVNINQIKFVKINLVLLKQDTGGTASTFTVNAGTTIRNLKINLGN
jgi:type II secretory pathway pseudopilin PulG